MAPVMKSVASLSPLNNIMIKGKEPRTILGIVVAAVALKLVPNCSAAIVTKIAQKPVEKPRHPHNKYIVEAEPPFCIKNKTIDIMVNT